MDFLCVYVVKCRLGSRTAGACFSLEGRLGCCQTVSFEMCSTAQGVGVNGESGLPVLRYGSK